MPPAARLTPELLDGILDAVRKGAPVAAACDAAAVSRQSFYRWRNGGAALDDAIHQAEATGGKAPRLSAHQRLQLRLHRDLPAARAEAHLFYVDRLRALAEGGETETEIREKVGVLPDGTTGVVERVTTVRRRASDIRAVLFALERSWPNDWGRAERPVVDDGLSEDTEPIGREATQDPEVRALVGQLRARIAERQHAPPPDHPDHGGSP